MLTSRWAVLALLFLVRACMGAQFQAVPALAPLLIDRYLVTVADIGLLIGLYQAPGILLSLPGGALARRLGDKRVVLAGIALMTLGGLMMALLPGWPGQMAARLLAGCGAILLNVVMTKMVSDWFTGAELATAMAIFVNSWPCGIALALIVLPALAAATGLGGALLAIALTCAAALAAMTLLYASPPASPAAPVRSGWPSPKVISAVLVAAVIWGLYNAGLSMIFAFGPLMLAERGYTVIAASAMTSTVLWVVTLSIPLGGVLADRSRRPGVVMALSLAGFAALLPIAARTDAVLPVFVALGLIGGLAAGPVMSLAGAVLTPGTRAIGMGLFFTLYYVFLMGAPWLAGHLVSAWGSARIAFDFGAIALALAFPVWALFDLQRRSIAARQLT